MNWKIIVLGGLAFWLAAFIIGTINGFWIHGPILDEAYKAAPQFWRPELRPDEPDMAALMPMWVFNGIVMGMVMGAIYGLLRPAFGGAGWKRGLSFGLLMAAFTAAYHMQLSGYFDVAGKIWGWWSIDVAIVFAIAGAVLGIVVDKVAPGS